MYIQVIIKGDKSSSVGSKKKYYSQGHVFLKTQWYPLFTSVVKVRAYLEHLKSCFVTTSTYLILIKIQLNLSQVVTMCKHVQKQADEQENEQNLRLKYL